MVGCFFVNIQSNSLNSSAVECLASAFRSSLDLISRVTFELFFPVDYVHSETSVTPLMVAAGRGFLGVVEQLLNMGASAAVRSINGWQAIDWAQKYDQLDVLELIEAHVLVRILVKKKRLRITNVFTRDLLQCL